jgi:hypothetical protein
VLYATSTTVAASTGLTTFQEIGADVPPVVVLVLLPVEPAGRFRVHQRPARNIGQVRRRIDNGSGWEVIAGSVRFDKP